MRKYKWWIKERHNPQIGTYYIAMGQISNAAAKRAEDTLYGFNVMKSYETEDEYRAALRAFETVKS